jgi:hypothetical protein
MPLDTVPTLAGFTNFVQTNMGISTSVLPSDSPWLEYSFDVSMLTVNVLMCQVSPAIYTLAVYNLGGDVLLNNATDVPNAPNYKNRQPYFAYMRGFFNIYGFVSGVVSSASDEGTSESLVVPDSLSQLSLSDLQNLKTPWGRTYLALAQKYGPAPFNLV